MNSEKCPEENELAAYVSGALEENSAQSVSEHVESCPSCEESVCKLEAESDTVLGKLKLPNRTDPYAEEEECDRAIELVKELGKEPSVIDEVTIAPDPSTGKAKKKEEKPAEEDLGMLGHYRLITKLGQGGMGAVYKAKHTKLKRIVALKVLPSNLLQDEAAIARFEREMEAVGALDHPNIVRASDAGEIDGTHYLVMELVKGDDLAVVVNRRGPLPVADACEVVRQAAIGLQHAMENGLVHRDIKPANLMLNKEGQVKILDMGLALLDEPFGGTNAGLTSTGQMMGTVDFMAPEQVTDSHKVDIRADVYALGCTIYRLLSGVAPFQDAKYDNVVFKAMAHVDTPPPPLGERRAGLPPELIEIVEKMLAKKPDDRFQTPAELSAALVPFAVGHDLPALLVQTPTKKSTTAADLEAATVPPASKPKLPETLASSPEPSASGRGKIPRNKVKIAAGFFGGLFAILGLTVILLPTPHGTIRIEVGDPKIDVTVGGDGRYRVKGDQGEFEVTAGPHTLEITAGGTTFQTKEFTVGKDEQVALRVTLLDGKAIQVVDGDKVIDEHSLVPAATASTDASKTAGVGSDRELAEHLLALGDTVSLYVDGVNHYLEPPSKVVPPGRDVRLIWVASNRTDIQPEDVKRISSCKTLQMLQLYKYPFTEEELERLSSLPLTVLTVYGKRLTEKAFSQVRKITSLEHLNLRGFTYVSDASVLSLASLKYLNDLKIETDPDIKRETLAALAKALPRCLIRSELGKFNSGNFQLGFANNGPASVEGFPTVSSKQLTCELYYTPAVEGVVGEQQLIRLGDFAQLAVEPKANRLKFELLQKDGTGEVERILGPAIEQGRRVHVAAVCADDDILLFVDGELVQRKTTDGQRRDLAGTLDFGSDLHGQIDEVRVSTVARYHENFTPAERHEPDADTLALYHFDSGYAGTLKDSSGNGHHGKIVGAKWVRAGRDAGLFPSPMDQLSHATIQLSDVQGPQGRPVTSIPNELVGIFKIDPQKADPSGMALASVAFNHDGSLLFGASAECGNLTVWDTATGKLKTTIKDNNHGLNRIACHPEGNLLALGGTDQTVRLRTPEGKLVGELIGSEGLIRSVNFSPDGKLLATSANVDHLVKIWDVKTFKEKSSLARHKSDIHVVEFSPDGRTFLSGSQDQRLVLWDLKSGDPLWEVQSDSEIWAAAFHPDGSLIATGGEDSGDVTLWDVSTGAKVRTIKAGGNGVYGLAIHPDGSQLATYNWSGPRLIDFASGKTIQSWQIGKRDFFRNICFDPTGRYLAFPNNDGTAYILRLAELERATTGKIDGAHVAVPTRQVLPNGWVIEPPVNMGTVVVNSKSKSISPAFSSDERTLIFGSSRPDGQGSDDLWMSKRSSPDEPFDPPVNLGPIVNSDGWTGLPNSPATD